jgi:hypothetical protein
MREILFLKGLKESVRASRVYLPCVFMIAFLTGACASGDTKQTSFEIPPPPSIAELSTSGANETGQVSAKGESENGVTELTRIPTLPVTPQEPAEVEGVNSDDYEEECRNIAVTGSRLKRRICASKAEWAAFDRRNRKDTEQLYRDADKIDVNTGSGTDPFGGQSGGMKR